MEFSSITETLKKIRSKKYL